MNRVKNPFHDDWEWDIENIPSAPFYVLYDDGVKRKHRTTRVACFMVHDSADEYAIWLKARKDGGNWEIFTNVRIITTKPKPRKTIQYLMLGNRIYGAL
jgi:hypothetical protein